MIILPMENQEQNDLLRVISQKKPTEESTVIQHDPPYLALGKAMHLLLNVKSKVFELAVQKLDRDKLSAESPVTNALLSLENHISLGLQRSLDPDPAFSPIYGALKEKILKRSTTAKNESDAAMRLARFLLLESQHRIAFGGFLETELKAIDKRSQLAAVLLLDSVVQTWPDIDDIGAIDSSFVGYSINVVAGMAGNLTRIATASPQPTLLACTAWDLVWTCSRYGAATLSDLSHSTESQLPKIVLMEPNLTIDKEKRATLGVLWEYTASLVGTIRTWHPTMDFIQDLAWRQVSLFLSRAHTLTLRDSLDSGLVQIANAWVSMTSVLNTRNILSLKPLSPKKRASLITKNHATKSPLLEYPTIVSLAALQKGQWIRIFNIQGSPVPLSDDEEQERTTIKTVVYNMINHPFLKPFDGLGNGLIACLFLLIPHLTKDTKLTTGALQTLLGLDWDLEGLINMVGYESIVQHIKCVIEQQPEEGLLYLLEGIDDSQTLESCFKKSVIEAIIEAMIGAKTQTDSSDVSQPLMNTLLMFAPTTHVACELLIKCMPLLYLPELISRLMKMAYTLDPRQNQVSKGLIAKALLVDSWAGESILLYVDLIRDFKYRKGFSTVLPGERFTYRSTPADLKPAQDLEDPSVGLDNSDVEKYVMEFISVLGLWGEKAPPWALEAGLRQMVHSTCGSPLDQTNVLVWKTLSFAILDHRFLVWVVMQECSDVMKLQRSWIDYLHDESTTDALFEKKLYAILTPMIILQVGLLFQDDEKNICLAHAEAKIIITITIKYSPCIRLYMIP
ncbi:hypothetical protein CLU79DRAFT_759060 [Phycomyces nitens]|nr:hypothetical protein CLU79DRAFT_759060 [Phycomyces nitens]